MLLCESVRLQTTHAAYIDCVFFAIIYPNISVYGKKTKVNKITK